jgi:hypothetical protein
MATPDVAPLATTQFAVPLGAVLVDPLLKVVIRTMNVALAPPVGFGAAQYMCPNAIETDSIFQTLLSVVL